MEAESICGDGVAGELTHPFASQSLTRLPITHHAFTQSPKLSFTHSLIQLAQLTHSTHSPLLQVVDHILHELHLLARLVHIVRTSVAPPVPATALSKAEYGTSHITISHTATVHTRKGMKLLTEQRKIICSRGWD